MARRPTTRGSSIPKKWWQKPAPHGSTRSVFVDVNYDVIDGYRTAAAAIREARDTCRGGEDASVVVSQYDDKKPSSDRKATVFRCKGKR